jgi:hypothetical protein
MGPHFVALGKCIYCASVVQMKDGHDFIKGLSNFQALSQQSLGVKLTVQGFLTFFYEKIANGMADMEAMFKYFKESDLEVEKMGPKLQEHLILIALLTAEDGYYGLPDAESVGTAMVDSGDESDHSSKKPRIDKP